MDRDGTHENSKSRAPARKPPTTGLWIAVAVVLGLHTVLVAAFWARWFGALHRVDGIESTVLNTVLFWRAGYPPYSHLERVPEGWSPYGPLYQWLCTLVSLPGNPYLAGRVFSLACFVATAASIVAFSRRCFESWAAGLLIVPLLLTARPVEIFSFVERVDILAIALGMGGLLLVTTTDRRAAWIAGVVLISLAVQVKLSALVAPAAAVLILLPRDRRRALWVGAGCLTLSAAGVWLTQWLTRGAYLYDLGLLTQDPRQFNKAFDMMSRPLTSTPLWLAAAGYAWWKLRAEDRSRVWPWVVYAGLALVAAGVTGMHPGSSWNYLLEFYVALGLLTAALLAVHLRRPEGGAATRVIAGLLCAHGLFAIWYSTQITYDRKYARELPVRERKVARMRSKLQPLLASGKRIAILHSEDGVDALQSLGHYNPVDAPQTGYERVEEDLLRRALREGTVDQVLSGDDLHPWHRE